MYNNKTELINTHFGEYVTFEVFMTCTPSPLIKALREVANFIRRDASFLCGAKNRSDTVGYVSGRLISQASKLRKADMLGMSQLFSKT